MTVERRTVLKGMLATASWSAVGIPRISWSSSSGPDSRPVHLLIGRTPHGEAFGAEVLGAAQAAGQTVSVSRLAAGHAYSPERIRVVLEEARGGRLIGMLDPAACVVFMEIARDAGARLVWEGTHAADGAVSRHAIVSVPGFHGVAEELASALSGGAGSFAVAETPIGAGARPLFGTDWGKLGFRSWHVKGERPLWLHVAGADLEEACAALGVDPSAAEGLICWKSRGEPRRRAAHWTAALGQGLAERLLGTRPDRVPAIAQVFVGGNAVLTGAATGDRVVSFVIEI